MRALTAAVALAALALTAAAVALAATMRREAYWSPAVNATRTRAVVVPEAVASLVLVAIAVVLCAVGVSVGALARAALESGAELARLGAAP